MQLKLYKLSFFIFFTFPCFTFSQIGYQQKGKASFYHDKFHGRRTASGERFNQNKFTAAHRKLLFNTMVKVTNLANDRSVIVRINDRGPYKYANRIIDLTLAAAQELKMTGKGVANVKIEVVGEDGKVNFKLPNTLTLPGSFENKKIFNYKGEERNPKGYGIQVAAFAEVINARYFARQLYKEGFREIVIKVGQMNKDTLLYKVVVGEFKTQNQALELIPKLKKKDFTGFPIKY